MKVLVVEPGTAPYEKEVNGQEEMKAIVGGPISARYIPEEQVSIVSNDDAILTKEHFNRSLGRNDGIFGTFFICGDTAEDGFKSLSPEQLRFYKQRFYAPEVLLGSIKGEWAIVKVEPMRIQQKSKEKRARRPKRR